MWGRHASAEEHGRPEINPRTSGRRASDSESKNAPRGKETPFGKRRWERWTATRESGALDPCLTP